MSMNLGDAVLSQVNCKSLHNTVFQAYLTAFPANRPQLNRADSKQSVAASDDFYSISDVSSEDRQTVVRYQTPPLRTGSADTTQSSNPRTVSPLSTHQEDIEPPTPVTMPRGPPQQVRSVSRQERVWQDSHVDAGAPTPGLDDSPYISFAIDQLTRDEEVSGRNRISMDSRLISSIPTVPVAAVVKDEQNPRQSRITSSKYSAGPTEKLPIEAIAPKPAARNSVQIPVQVSPEIGILPEPQKSQLFPPIVSTEERAKAVLLPATPRSSDYRYPPLKFVPGPLRLLPILVLVIFCLALIVVLIISSVLGAKHNGLLGYDGVGTARYFIFEYLPQFLAAIIVVWLLTIQAAIQRILPFTLLARANGYPDEDVFDRIPIYITNYLWPNTSLLRRGPSLKFCALIFWLALFTIPLASSLYQTRWYSEVGNGAFLWTTVQPISILLIILYTLLIIALIITYTQFNRYTTGLKWDPVSLADIIVLLRRTSTLTSSRTSKTTRRSSSRPHSLGYWESTSRPGAIFHGIGSAHGVPLASDEKDSIDDLEARRPLQQSTFESWHSNHWTSNRTYPTFLRESRLIFYAVVAVALLTAFLVVTYLRSALIAGFLPLLPTATPDTSSFTSFSPSNFLYSFIPSLLGLLLALFWIPIDTAFRYLRPWSTLTRQYPSSASQTIGHPASSTLLLSYPSAHPFLTTIRALSHGHLRIAWFSFMSLVASTLPVLAGGIFTAQYIASSPNDKDLKDQSRGGNILIRPDAGALYAVTFILILYAISWLLVLPGAKTRAIAGPDGRPVDVRYLAGIRTLVDKSVLREATWVEPRTRIDLVTRLVASEGLRGKDSGLWTMVGGRIARV